jgi:valyl-tRNA synthetase
MSNKKTPQIPPAYNAADYEDAIYKLWEESGAFRPEAAKDKSKHPFVITMPPPNATGQLHLGHSVMLALEDIMCRFARMKGHPTLWIPGTDHAGIATQTTVERKIASEEGKTRHDYGRKDFVQVVKDFVENSQDTIRNQTRKMGASCDWSREYYSLDESLTRTVYATFSKMFKEGLIYRGNRIVNWCTRCHSSISDDEVEYQEQKTNFYHFQYGPFEIGTVRPETKYGDHIVVVHPEDERYKQYHGKKIQVEWLADEPITATVFADPLSDMEMGTGVMTITPAHSFVDFDLAKEHGFEITQMIDEDGKMTAANGPHEGITVEKARETYVDILQKKGLVNKIDKEYENKLSICSRCKTPVQPLVSKQWFIDVNHPVNSWDHKNLQLEEGRAYSVKEVMQHVVRSSQIQITPEREFKRYFQWIDNLRDWCISRQLWWGHQIPVWYQESNPDEVKVNDTSPGKGWIQDEDTLDTWFSAGLFTFSPLKWIDGHDDFKKFHPTSVMETGYDILFFWVARMILMTTYMTGQVPFEKVYLHGMVRDRDGKKMSKSRPETCIDPLDIIPKYGADALRLSLFVGSSPGADSRLYDEKIAGYRNFINKLWNVSRYILMSASKNVGTNNHLSLHADPDFRPTPQTLADKWIVSKFNHLIQSTTEKLEAMDFSSAAEDLYHFTWNELADWYIEIAKVEGSKDDTLLYILRKLLILWHPFTPYVTEEIWKNLGQSDLLISTRWPSANIDLINPQAERDFELIQEIIGSIRNSRAEAKVEPAKKIKAVIISKTKADIIKTNTDIIKFLARLETLEVNAKKPKNTSSTFIGDIEIHLPLEGMVDPKKEKVRLQKEVTRLEDYVKQLKTKLGNKKFVANAPKDVIARDKQNVKEAEESLKKTQKQLGALK